MYHLSVDDLEKSIWTTLLGVIPASLFALWVSLHTIRKTSILTERVRVVSKVMRTLDLVEEYAAGRIGEMNGNDLGVTRPEVTRSCKDCRDHLRLSLHEAEPFLTTSERKLLHGLYERLHHGAMMELSLLMAKDEDQSPLYDLYRELRKVAPKVRAKMLTEVRTDREPVWKRWFRRSEP